MEIAKLDVQIGTDIKPLVAGLDQAKQQLINFANLEKSLGDLKPFSPFIVQGIQAAKTVQQLTDALAQLKIEQAAASNPAELVAYNNAIKAVTIEVKRLQTQTQVIPLNSTFNQAESSIKKMGSALTSSLTSLRQLAYILPGIGIAGIFNAAFNAISDVVEGLFHFQEKEAEAEARTKEFTDAFENLNKFIESTKNELGDSVSVIDTATSAFNQMASTVKLLQENYEHLTPVMKELLDKLLPDLASKSVQLAEAQLEEQQKLNIGLNQLTDQRAQHDLELQKTLNEAIISNTKASYGQRFSALKNVLAEQKAINQEAYDSELQATNGNLVKIKQAEENFRFSNLQAEQKYNQEYLKLEQKQAEDAGKILEAQLAAMRAQWERFNKERSKFSGQIAIETGPLNTPTTLDKMPALIANIKKPFQDVNQVIKEMAANLGILGDAAIAIGQAFGEIFAQLLTTGKTSFKAIEQALQSLIKKLVETVIESAILAGILSAISGGALTFSGAFKSLLGGTFPHLAGGGIATGPTTALIGESGPEAVIPLDRLQQMIGGLGGSNISISGELRAHGTDLVVALNRGNVRINRNYGQNFTN